MVEAQAGENWHAFMLDFGPRLWRTGKPILIPGNVGTAPIQNIGAYGVELKDVFVSCTALNRKNLTVQDFDLAQADFGYRSSYFKTQGKINM